MSTITDEHPSAPGLRSRMYHVIFHHDTPAGKAFDVALLVLILLSVLVVMLESVDSVRERYGTALWLAEWGFTILFTLEYILRLASVRHPLNYAKSFYGVVDVLAVLPTYLSLLFPGAQALIVVRALRLLRVFRVFKLTRYTGEVSYLAQAMNASRRKITVFVFSVSMIVLIVGSLMYLIEGPENGFTSIPISCYWSIVTLTTVGYGDITPQTLIGRLLASVLMLTGYGIIAVPTGIVTAELVAQERRGIKARKCPSCQQVDHDTDAVFCKHCAASLTGVNESTST